MVFRLLTARWRHGSQAVPDPMTALPDPMFRGFPEIAKNGNISAETVSLCPGAALSADPVTIDLGKCHLCGLCTRDAASPIRLTNRHHLGQTKRDALDDTWSATPSPKLLILMGTCAISGGLFAASPALDRRFFKDHAPDIYIPGCPPHPLTVVNAILHYLGRGI